MLRIKLNLFLSPCQKSRIFKTICSLQLIAKVGYFLPVFCPYMEFFAWLSLAMSASLKYIVDYGQIIPINLTKLNTILMKSEDISSLATKSKQITVQHEQCYFLSWRKLSLGCRCGLHKSKSKCTPVPHQPTFKVKQHVIIIHDNSNIISNFFNLYNRYKINLIVFIKLLHCIQCMPS